MNNFTATLEFDNYYYHYPDEGERLSIEGLFGGCEQMITYSLYVIISTMDFEEGFLKPEDFCHYLSQALYYDLSGLLELDWDYETNQAVEPKTDLLNVVNAVTQIGLDMYLQIFNYIQHVSINGGPGEGIHVYKVLNPVPVNGTTVNAIEPLSINPRLFFTYEEQI